MFPHPQSEMENGFPENKRNHTVKSNHMKQVADLRKGLCNPLIIGTIELLNWGCPNNSAPFELNLDKTPKRPHILLLIGPILLILPRAPNGPFLCCANALDGITDQSPFQLE